jgi:hypothetical protein
MSAAPGVYLLSDLAERRDGRDPPCRRGYNVIGMKAEERPESRCL